VRLIWCGAGPRLSPDYSAHSVSHGSFDRGNSFRDDTGMNRFTRSQFRLVLGLSLLAFIISSLNFSDDAEARRRRKRRVKQPKVINEKNLFERLGGKDVISKAVDDWIRLAMADTGLAAKLAPLAEKPQDFAKSRKRLQDEICELSDGPCEPADSEWVAIRQRSQMDETQAVAFTSFLSEALVARGVGERERNELLGRLGQIEPLVVSEATGPASERRGGNR
jgi:hypothetical protein